MRPAAAPIPTRSTIIRRRSITTRPEAVALSEREAREGKRRRIAYFAHELRDPAVQRRVRMLKAAGCAIELLGFERRDFPLQDGADAPTQVLGRTQSGKFISRALSVLAAIPKVMRLRAHWEDADAILARNLEMLAIACAASSLLRLDTRIVYECLDIHDLMLGKGPASVILRAIERACLRRASLVIVSSAAYRERYFRAIQRHPGAILLVENKVFEPPCDASPPPTREGPPWRILWCGVLRCRKSLDILARLAARPDIEVALYGGAPSLEQIPDFHAIVENTPSLTYFGAFPASDLPRIYADADFAWSVNYYQADGNSRWLLPNRLYDSLRFGCVPIALAGVETGRWLVAHDVGVAAQEPIDNDLQVFFDALTPQSMRELQASIAALPRGASEMDRSEAWAIAGRIAGEAPAPSPARVLIIIPCLNEAAHLPQLLQSLLDDPESAGAHIVVADGGSADASCAIVEDFASRHPRISLLHNPRRLQGAAVNLAVERFGANADFVLRMDAHARYPAGFVAGLLAAQEASGADAVAVSMRTVAHGGSCFEHAVAAAQNSILGTGGSLHRAQGRRRFVDHGHHALFRRDAFLAVDGYDENYAQNQDAELDARLTQRGYGIVLAADTVIDYFPRASVGKLLRQYFAFGMGRANTMRRHRMRPKLRQALPVLVAPAVIAAALAPIAPWAALPAAAWLSGCLVYGLVLGLRAGDICAAGAGVPAAIMHLAWSCGFWNRALHGVRTSPERSV